MTTKEVSGVVQPGTKATTDVVLAPGATCEHMAAAKRTWLAWALRIRAGKGAAIPGIPTRECLGRPGAAVPARTPILVPAHQDNHVMDNPHQLEFLEVQ